MRGILVLFGILIMLVGAWPTLSTYEFVPEAVRFIPITGNIYQGIVVAIGLILFVWGMKRKIKIK